MSGNIYVTNSGTSEIKKVVADGSSKSNFMSGLNSPRAIDIGPYGYVYVADFYNHRILKVDPNTASSETVAGTGVAGFSGDGGDAASAQLDHPMGVAVDGSGNIYIADTRNYRIRKVIGPGPPTSPSGSSASSEEIRYVPFASKYLLMALMALLGGWLVLRRN